MHVSCKEWIKDNENNIIIIASCDPNEEDNKKIICIY